VFIEERPALEVFVKSFGGWAVGKSYLQVMGGGGGRQALAGHGAVYYTRSVVCVCVLFGGRVCVLFGGGVSHFAFEFELYVGMF